MEKTIASALYRAVLEALVAVRKEAGMTQRQLAARLRREPSFVAKIELGERRVDVLELYRICKACNQPPSTVLLRLIKRFEALERTKP